ncbi:MULTISPECIES: hypothetical protein [Chryseobacterium]|uniref:Uncharacterized protein n=1 Tax=Chryseobacterium camelliae TaxID=1265445 RepID=A0ABU0TJG5_9FLAO|nr:MULTISPECIES: hypothetical protein [Chryseobacterium]MDT3408960.1 hypothetical protein [Pseudacidovorax intermedius]MDQ1097183.1 hypothetical protein [Chryseobacterium camelliae]MDQ1101120.1 hypothetical protein [Chryseobacterium sp. SORGH_AS_1048]MDR6084563.1 hypothetical protein [Chryseobacterium sp. SORGH_AS_0909]MDR6132832.1 hypothetical protein [Chryseobacterium sp. SORGH_AS_1175]
MKNYAFGKYLEKPKKVGLKSFEEYQQTTANGNNDHISLRDQDVSHPGYKKFESIKKDLIKRNPKYKQIFDAKLKHYEKSYKSYKKN